MTDERGVDEANRLIRKIVLQARVDYKSIIQSIDLDDKRKLESLEEETDKWSIPKGLHALAALRTHFPKSVAGKILTTNFDPLIEIALERQRNAWYSTALHADGSLLYLRGSGSHVIHLHGRWCGSDTLHTPEQLTGERPQLEASLRTILGESTLVILGYGGWDDIITNALQKIINENDTRVNVLWGYYESDEKKILESSGGIFKKLADAKPVGRVQFYKGVEADTVLIDAFEMALSHKPAQDITTLMNVVQLQRTRQVSYQGLADPWCDPDKSLGYLMQELSRLDKRVAIKVALYGLTYLLPLIESQGIHQAPVQGRYCYIRKAMNLCLQLLDSGCVYDPKICPWLSCAISAIQKDAAKDLALKTPLTSASQAIAALLAFVSTDYSYDINSDNNPENVNVLVAKSIHGFCRALHDDDGALWAYVTHRITGRYDHLKRFNSNWQNCLW